MLRLLRALLCIIPLTALAANAADEQWTEKSIVKAAAVGGHLFLLSEDARSGRYALRTPTHRLVGYALNTGARSVLSRFPLMDMSIDHGSVWTMSAPWIYFAPATISRLEDGVLSPVAKTPAAIGDLVAFDVANAQIYVVGLRGIAIWSDGRWKVVRLSAQPDRPWAPVARVTADKSLLYLGDNRGEWGGALYRIDLATGHIVAWQGENVTAILRHPSRPDCVLVAIGVSHFLTSGDVRNVCGDKTTILFKRTLPPYVDIDGKRVANDFCRECTYPIFGLAVTSEKEIWAVTHGAFFHLQDEDAQQIDMREPEEWHGLILSRPAPGLLAVWSLINARVSLSGATPLLVSLDPGG